MLTHTSFFFSQNRANFIQTPGAAQSVHRPDRHIFILHFLSFWRYADLKCIHSQLKSSKVTKMAMLLEAAESCYSPALTNIQQDVLAGKVKNMSERSHMLECCTCVCNFVSKLNLSTSSSPSSCQHWKRPETSAPTWGPCSVCLRRWRMLGFLMSGVTLALWCTQCVWFGQTPGTTTPQHASLFCCRRPATSSYNRSAALTSLCQVGIQS